MRDTLRILWTELMLLLALSWLLASLGWGHDWLLISVVIGATIVAYPVFLHQVYMRGAAHGLQVAEDEITKRIKENLEEARKKQEPREFRLTGGGPMDGETITGPPEAFADFVEGLARIMGGNASSGTMMRVGDEDGFIGTYVPSEEDPTVLIWQERGDEDDEDV